MPPTLPKKKFAGVVAVLTLGVVALLSLAALPKLAAATFILGFVIALPLIGVLGTDFPLVEADDAVAETARVADATDAVTDRDDTTVGESPVETLRARYARGELTDEEFERRLDRLLETERLTDEDGRETERA